MAGSGLLWSASGPAMYGQVLLGVVQVIPVKVM
jgi:hypothetical protein